MLLDTLGAFEEMPSWEEASEALFHAGHTLNPSTLHGAMVGLLGAGFSPQSEQHFTATIAAIATDPDTVTATAPYGNQAVVAAVGRGSLQATQFHPEKSGLCGLALLQRWLNSFQ